MNLNGLLTAPWIAYCVWKLNVVSIQGPLGYDPSTLTTAPLCSRTRRALRIHGDIFEAWQAGRLSSTGFTPCNQTRHQLKLISGQCAPGQTECHFFSKSHEIRCVLRVVAGSRNLSCITAPQDLRWMLGMILLADGHVTSKTPSRS